MNPQVSKEARTVDSPVQFEIGCLVQAISDLSILMENLDNRLSIVSAPPFPSNEKEPGLEERQLSAVPEQIRSNRKRIEQLCRHLSSINERLEL